jgi:alkylation response protein AidB-like acyl-CoA dehydrogenase
MSSSSDTAPPSVSDDALDHAAQEMGALARERAGAIERERRLPDDLVGRLRASGLMRAGAPRSLGAAQAPPAVTLGCAETVARGDASAGWCVSIAATSSLLSAYLPRMLTPPTCIGLEAPGRLPALEAPCAARDSAG